jgi:hypothetical protein
MDGYLTWRNAMTRILVDGVLSEKLQALKGPAELHDAEGKVIARVFPASQPYIGREPPITDEEIQRRREYQGPMRSTAEVLKRLESL